MRIRSDEELIDMQNSGKTTRAMRAAAKASARIKARHVERDYFGRPVEPLTPVAPSGGVDGVKRAGTRLDAWLVANGAAPSRDKAKILIAEGRVTVNGSGKVKPSTLVPDNARVEVEPTQQQ